MSSKAIEETPLSSKAIEEIREAILAGAPESEWQGEEWRWLFLGERAITMVYWEILEDLKKQDSLEEVKRIIEWGELEIVKIRGEGRTGLNRHMEEWEKGR